jgi:hypothetical protein
MTEQQPRLRKPEPPPATAPAKLKKPHPLDRFLGQRITVTTMNGTLIEGTMTDRAENTLTLEGVTIQGNKQTATGVAVLVLFLKSNISHINTLAMDLVRELP